MRKRIEEHLRKLKEIRNKDWAPLNHYIEMLEKLEKLLEEEPEENTNKQSEKLTVFRSYLVNIMNRHQFDFWCNLRREAREKIINSIATGETTYGQVLDNINRFIPTGGQHEE